MKKSKLERPARLPRTERPAEPAVRLTLFSSCAGCAAKLSQTLLAELLTRLPPRNSSNGNRHLLVDSDTFDDGGVYRLNKDTALIQTVDFFTPIVDNPYDYGQIAAANAISDVYAMGGRPITAMNLLGVPTDKIGPETIALILSGGAQKAAEAHCVVLGGHTIRLPEPVYGLSVTGVVHPRRILTNARAEPGDVLVLTKPLGTGIATTAIKRGLASQALAVAITRSMKQLNTAGAEIGERRLASAATDVTGFGLMGHLGNIVRASGVGAEIVAADVPHFGDEIFSLIEQDCVPGGTLSNFAAAEALVDWTTTRSALRTLLCDAQTSGGLLLCVKPRRLGAVKKVLHKHKAMVADVIGFITRAVRPRIIVRA